MLFAFIPILLNFLSKQQKMKIQLRAWFSIPITTEVIANDKTNMIIPPQRAQLAASALTAVVQTWQIIPAPINAGTSPIKTAANKSQKEEKQSIMINRGKLLKIKLIALLAESMQPSPVTDITIMALLFKTLIQSSTHLIKHSAINAIKRSDPYDFFAVAMILSAVIIVITIEPKQIEPRWYLILFIPLNTLLFQLWQYQQAQALAIRNTIQQQRKKPQKIKSTYQTKVRTWNAVSLLAVPTEQTPSQAKTQNTMNAAFNIKHIREMKYTAGFQVMNLAAHCKSFRPVFIQDQKQYSMQAVSNPIIMKEIARPQLLITNPRMIRAMQTKNVNPIKKYMVCLGKVLPSTINKTDNPQARTNIPTIGPASFAITYPNPEVEVADQV